VAITAVGSIALDTITTSAGTAEAVLGGSLTYFSLAASLFAPVHMVGVVGGDFPAAHLAWFRERPIHLEGLEQRAGGRTFRWSGRYSDDCSMRTTTALALNVFQTFRPQLPPAARRQPYLFLGNIDPALQRHVLDQMEHPAFVVSDTMDHWIAQQRDALLALLPQVHVFLLNDEEARLLAQTADTHRAAQWVVAHGVDCAIVKCGAQGSILATVEGVTAMPAFRVERLADPTGAGDSFAGGLLGYIAAQQQPPQATLHEAILYGAAVASWCVEALGVERLRHLTREMIETRVAQLRPLVDRTP